MKKPLSHPVRATSIADFWPGKALRATINESRPIFGGQQVLVTGACGFVGGHLVRALHAAGAHVVAFDKDTKLTDGCQLDLIGLQDHIQMFEGDVTNRRHIEELVLEGGFSHIFHLSEGTTTSENTTGFANLVEGAALLPEAKRPVVIYASSDKGEELNSNKSLGVPTIVLNMCNVFGPYDLSFDDRLISRVMCSIFRDGESPELPMDSVECLHEYLFVEDAITACLSVARQPACYGHTYELPGVHCSSTPDILRDIVTLVGDLQDKEFAANRESALSKHHWNRSIRVSPSKPNLLATPDQQLDNTPITRKSGFEPMTSFRQGLEATAQFYLWYFNEFKQQVIQVPDMAPSTVEIQVTAPKLRGLHNDDDERFETIFTEDGLPVHRLKPISARTVAAAENLVLKPSSFLSQTWLAA